MYFNLKSAVLILCIAFFGSCKTTSNSYQESVISLQRTGCYGTCPIWQFELHRNGGANLINKRFVEPLGSFASLYNADSVSALFEQFSKTDWDLFHDEYPDQNTDLPSVILTWKHCGFEKRIVIVGKHPEQLDVLIKEVEATKEKLSWKKI